MVWNGVRMNILSISQIWPHISKHIPLKKNDISYHHLQVPLITVYHHCYPVQWPKDVRPIDGGMTTPMYRGLEQLCLWDGQTTSLYLRVFQISMVLRYLQIFFPLFSH